MVYTITFNPALDYILQVEKFEIDKINRTTTEKILPGGKGLNVSTVLNNLEIENTALGFIAGFTGEQLREELKNKGIKTEFIKVQKGITRINVKISSEKETAINANGPDITSKDIEQLLEQIKKIEKQDIVVLAGNIPKGISKNIYEKICQILKDKQITFIVDATKELLLSILKYNPFLIKPNKEELEETFNIKIKTKEEIIKYAKELQKLGAQNVLISLGGDGAILVTQNEKQYFSKAPKGKVINTVGAGDSMVAGFIAGIKQKNKENPDKTKDNFEYALKMGIATGSASAFSTNLATKEEVYDLLKFL